MSGPPVHGPLTALRPHDAALALEDGTVFFGWSFGFPGEATGEAVFNTSLTGYPEIITDPSYRGQIVAFTYPLIGNYGVNAEDAESPKPQLSGVIVRSACGRPSSWRSRESLPDYLRRHRIVAVEGIDTRALTRRLRSAGVMRAVISTRDLDPASLVARAKASPGLVGRDLVAEVTPFEVTPWLAPVQPGEWVRASAPVEEPPDADDRAMPAEIDLLPEEAVPDNGRGMDAAAMAVEAIIEARRHREPLVLPVVEPALVRPKPRLRGEGDQPPPLPPAAAGSEGGSSADTAAATPRIAVLHCGMKANIAEELRRRGAAVRIYPAGTSIRAILADRPDGLLLSNGPGDPEGVTGVVEEVREALGRVPIFGICLGIQMLTLALGGRTYKLKFGHRGGNQPVLDLTTGRVEITSQNHGFAVDPESLMPAGPGDRRDGLQITHLNLNDGTVEGFEHAGLDVLAVQYHPEAAPGPHDSAYLFDRFLARVRARMAGPPAGAPRPAEVL